MGMRDIGRFLHLAQEVRCQQAPTHESPTLEQQRALHSYRSPSPQPRETQLSPVSHDLQVGLYVLLRPSPYICAEWDYGGMSALQLLSGERDPQVSGIGANWYPE
jgi:hypothetical protein